MQNKFSLSKWSYCLTFIVTLIVILGNLFSQSHLENRVEFSIEAGQYLAPKLTLPTLSGTNKVEKASQVKVEAISGEGGAWQLIFQFPESVVVKKEIEDGALFLEFNQPVDSPDLLKVQEKIGFLIKRFSNGYNTLYLVPRRPVFYQVEGDHQTLFLNIVPNEDEALEMTRQAKLAFARLLIEKRAYTPAFRSLFEMLNKYPNDKDVLVLYASLEGLLPRWQNQVGILQTLHTEYPLDEDIETLMYEAYTPHSSYIEGQRQMQRTVGIAAVQVYLLQGEAIVNSSPDNVLYAGAQYQLWDGHVSAIVNSHGNDVGFRGWRNRGSLYMRNEWRDGSTLKTSLYDQKSAFGVGLEYSTLFPFFQGSIFTELQWHRPAWEVFEALAFNGREDRFYSLMDSVYNRYISWSLGGGIRRVGITGTPNGFTSALATVGLYINLVIPNPIFGISYNLDAEYVLNRQLKKGANGAKFFPVPYTSFENHTLHAYLIYIFRDRWYISSYVGETFNRIGLNDSTFGAAIRYAKPLPCSWEAKISYDRFPSTIISGATAEYLTGTLIFRF